MKSSAQPSRPGRTGRHRPPALSLAAVAALALAALTGPRLSAADTTIAPPAHNWAMSLFSPEGYHTMNLGGSEVRPISSDRIDVVNMNIIVFTGGAKPQVETVVTSPSATFLLSEKIARGYQSVRLIRDDAEVTGWGWTYYADQKKVLIQRRARVTFQAAIPDLLK